jgi:hypothetical protein
MKGLYGIKLVLVFLFVYIISHDFSQRAERIPSPLTNYTNEKDSVVILDDFDISFNELISLNKWKRNPFLPYYNLSTENVGTYQHSSSIYTPQLEKIYRKNGVYHAVINNQALHEGDTYLDMTVAYIGESIIVLNQVDDQQIVLTLRAEL